jgi:hypothetical protein
MSSDQLQIENKSVELVKVVGVSEEPKVDEVLASTPVAQVAPVTPVAVIATAAIEAAGVLVISKENKLSEDDKKIVKLVYESAKNAVESILTNQNLDNVIKISMSVAQIIKLLETVTIDDHVIPGKTKKLVAIELGKTLINDLIKDDSVKATILPLYDLLAESTLEAMIDVSRNVNVKQVTEVATTCCTGIMALLRARATAVPASK